MLEVAELTVAYGRHRALERVSLQAAPGEVVAVLGANGAGKSSLLKAIGGMIAVAAGSRVTIGGRDVTHAKPHRIVEAGIALVPEGRGIFAELSVAENLELGAFARRARAAERANREAVLTLFPRLAERRRQFVRTMSGGEQQMVAIARAMMSAPQVLLLDEPSLGLSPLLTAEVFRALRKVRGLGTGILMVEQNAIASLAIADRGYLLENGRISRGDAASALRADPAVQRAYLGADSN